jgi:hypothetical protein
METRKIALIIFLVSLIFLSLGVIVYVARQRSEINSLQTTKLTLPDTKSKINPVNNTTGTPEISSDTGGTAVVTKDGKSITITEEQIKAKIEAKKAQISQQAKGRAYTSSELYFISFPREAVVSELENNQ